MAISIFIESYTEAMGNHKRQVLLVPMDNDIRVYMRSTDGAKGPQNKWLETDIESVVNDIDQTELLTAEPVGVYVSSSDETAIRDRGYSPVLTTKAIAAHSKSAAPTNSNPVAVLLDMLEKIETGAPELHGYVIDGRRTSGNTNAVRVELEDVEDINTSIHAPVIHAALASVPNHKLAERYVGRNVLGGVEDFRVFDDARANHINVLIYGPTGPGKTTAVTAWAAARGLRMATVSGNAALEPGHLFGKFVSDGRGGFVWIDGPVTDVVRNGGVLCLDEFNFISPKIYTVLYPLTDSRRTITLLDGLGEVIEAHEDLTIFATMNPEYIGTTPINKAMRNRFDIQIPWDYDDKVEAKLVKSKNLLALAKQLRDEAGKGAFETPISTNMLMEFCEFVPRLGYDFAVENFIAHFDSEEQAAVRLVFKTHEYNLKPDFGIDVDIMPSVAEPSAPDTNNASQHPNATPPTTITI